MDKNKVRIFYNRDCQKYGVEVFDKGTTSGWEGWRQVDTTKFGGTDVYTPYKKVAERWMQNFIKNGRLIK